MGKIIFCVVIGGLCFGQSIWLKENFKSTLPFPLSVSIKSPYLGTESLIKKHSFYSPNSVSPGSNIQFFLFSQVADESLQPKTSFWKQAGIYGLEFMGASVGTSASTIFGLLFASKGGDVVDDPMRGAFVYTIGNMLFTSSCTWTIGYTMRQKGTWWKSSLGAGLGCLVGIPAAILLSKKYPEGFMNGVALGIFLVTPPLGAVIGYNIK